MASTVVYLSLYKAKCNILSSTALIVMFVLIGLQYMLCIRMCSWPYIVGW